MRLRPCGPAQSLLVRKLGLPIGLSRPIVRLSTRRSVAVAPSRLATLSARLWVYCRDCCHERDVDPATVPLPAETAVPDVGKRMKCSACGSRKVTTTPERYPGRDRHASAADLGCPIGEPVKKPNGGINVY
jgi:hypothetical protein